MYQNFADYKEPDKKNIVVPFLNLRLKVHKMKREDLINKNTAHLRFRPIIDQKLWVFKHHSYVLRLMLEAMVEEVVANNGDKLANILPKNGADVAKFTKNLSFNDATS